jgi:modulator of FtsH protease
MSEVDLNISQGRESVIEVNKVLKNTYLLLSMTLLASALAAGAAMVLQIPQGVALMMMLGGFVCSFVVRAKSRSASGLFWIFLFAILWGGSLGPMLSYYVTAFSNGPAIIAQALGGTALIFFTLSGYALVSGKDFSYMGGFLLTGLIVAIVAMIANWFLQIPALSLAISAAVIMIMSGFILFDTSRIINGGERNYIMATVSLYLSIINIFVHLLHLLGSLTGRD